MGCQAHTGNGFRALVTALYGWLNKNGLLASLATAVATIAYTGTAQRLGSADRAGRRPGQLPHQRAGYRAAAANVVHRVL